MSKRHKYGIPLGRSGCRFVVGDVSRGDVRSFQFSRGGWGAAIQFARQMAVGSSFAGLIDIVCGKYPHRLPLMACREAIIEGRRVKHCEPEVFNMDAGERPIAGLRRRRRR